MTVSEMHYASDGTQTAAIRSAFEQYGVVLLRGFECDLDGFESMTRQFCKDFHEVGTRQVLRQAAGDGFTTEVFHNNFILLGHSEGAYRPYPPPPEVCFFMCVTPPVEPGGETTLVDGVEMLEVMPDDLRCRLEDTGVTYESQWEAERWKNEFGAHTEKELRALLGRFNNVRFSLTDGMLHLYYSAPAITCTRSGNTAFINGILAHLPQIAHPRYKDLPVYVKPTNRVYFGDGELLPDEVVNALIDAHDRVSYRHRWMANDVLIVDNTRYMHGREMTVQPCERVLVSRFGHLR